MPLINFLKDVFLLCTNECLNKGLNFILELDNNLPYWVAFDEQLLRQVLNNLLNNAFKFTDSGFLKIEARV